MTNFENFYYDLLDLAKKHELKNTPLRIEKDLENDIVKIFGERISSLSKAKNGLNDVTELAYTAAEHHPFWNLKNVTVTPHIASLTVIDSAVEYMYQIFQKIKKDTTYKGNVDLKKGY